MIHLIAALALLPIVARDHPKLEHQPQMLAFPVARSDSGSASDLYVCGLDGKGLKKICPKQIDYDQTLLWSPDGTRIAFRDLSPGSAHAWVVNRDGSHLRNLAPGKEAIPLLWIDPGHLEVMIVGEKGIGKEFSVSLSTFKRVPYRDRNVNFSPDHSRYVDGNNEKAGLFLLSRKRTILRLTRTIEESTEVAWSPNGRYVAVNDLQDKGEVLVIADANGRRKKSFYWSAGASLSNLAWAPDGKSIAFYAEDQRTRGIKVLAIKSGKVVPLVNEQVDWFDWTRDGREIIFQSYQPSVSIWRVPSKGGRKKMIVHKPRIFRPALSP